MCSFTAAHKNQYPSKCTDKQKTLNRPAKWKYTENRSSLYFFGFWNVIYLEKKIAIFIVYFTCSMPDSPITANLIKGRTFNTSNLKQSVEICFLEEYKKTHTNTNLLDKVSIAPKKESVEKIEHIFCNRKMTST